MVTHSGAKTRTDNVRSLNVPKPVTVIAEHGMPAKLITRYTEVAVMQIQDVWIVQDEWWRKEIDRQYFALLMMDGEMRTIFHDRVEDAWYEQAY